MKNGIYQALTAPLELRQSSPGWSYTIAVCWLVLGYYLIQYQKNYNERERLQEPVQAKVQFLSAQCQLKSGRNSPAFLNQTYTYQVPHQTQTYEVVDSIRYHTMAKCEAALPDASKLASRSFVWFDNTRHAKARWDLEEGSFTSIYWFTGLGFVLLVGLGIYGQRHQRAMKK
ncbi:hypothetical protein [Undibacterium fentianense]|uniref:Uncharacterized protein n=1 Tax=Undibacterium fentianense TaxID=2828728 RepID=A0A941ICS4_9BURK|nr:hypothetical protein [Undibacterium fentianense]MBR7800509.1 hypothetical protein [Undibacterium fentianense]